MLRSTLRWSVLVSQALVVGAGCCHRAEVSLRSPFDRYDHNRTRRLSVTDLQEPVHPTMGGGDDSPRARAHAFETSDYPPTASEQFQIELIEKDAPSDALPPAILVPTYPGVPLPLSDAPIAECSECRTDRADLIDYLATGPAAQAGIEAPDLAGAVKRDGRDFEPVLAVLSRRDLVTLDESAIRKALPEAGIELADAVHDTRYAPGAVGTTLAFRYRCFWFVLYRYPAQPGFTRLVVVNGAVSTRPEDKAPDAPSC